MANTRPALNKMAGLSGWQLSGLLLVLYVTSEWGTYFIGGNHGAYLYVTTHFVVMPLLSVLTIVLTTVRTFHTPTTQNKVLLFSSLVIPCAIILIAITGKPGISIFFGKF